MKKLVLCLTLAACGRSGAPARTYETAEVDTPPTVERFVDGGVDAPELDCVLSSPRSEWRLGEKVDLRVRIINRSSESVRLIGSLDGSDIGWRFPHCTFEIVGPDGAPTESDNLRRCGNMNDLRHEEIVEVAPGASFDPYQKLDNYGFFEHWIFYSDPFKEPGEYKLRFRYSTETDDDKAFMGDLRMMDGEYEPELAALVRGVPRLVVESNELSIRITE